MVTELTVDQQTVQQFREHGYVALRGFLNEQQVGKLRDNIARFIRNVVPQMRREEAFYEDKNDPSSLKQIQRMQEHDPFFRSMMFGSRFEALATVVMEHEVRGVNIQYFNKPAGVGKPTPAHQDGFYFMLQPNEAVTMWLALEDIDEENGCVRYVKCSHRRGLRPHGRTQTLGFSQGLLDYGDDDVANEIALPVQAGDLLVHHALTVHRADGNRSRNRSRQALGLVYFSTAAKEDADKSRRHAELLESWKREGKI